MPPPAEGRRLRTTPTVYCPTRRPALGAGHATSLMIRRCSLQRVRRWLLIIAAGVIIGVAVGWVSGPGETGGGTTFKATHTLLYEAKPGSPGYHIEQLAFLAT